ncbi:hypothetical protein LTR53_018039, partial [Teratosphaeriaceae sp. CCFEE 6253]
LLGAGGGRPSSTDMANISNGVLYGIFAFSAVGAGPLLNKIGPRYTLMFGITGYPVYQGAMWYFDESGLLWYPIFAGAYLGLSAGCLWTTAVFTATAYPEERDKGRWRSIQWSANVAGSAIGAAVALGVSWNYAVPVNGHSSVRQESGDASSQRRHRTSPVQLHVAPRRAEDHWRLTC